MTIRSVGKNCYGCSACYSTCKANAITMKEDKEGFYYPVLNDNVCINCNACVEVCPQITGIIKHTNHKVCAGIHSEKKIWKNSSSGGAFSAICSLFGDENTYVVGAIFNREKKRVEHSIIKGASNACVFSGSKYVQSYLGESFSLIKNLLDSGEKVIFSGTPCQVSGLRHFLGGAYDDNLLCIDLFCHGVSSPAVFRDYLKYLEGKYKSVITDYRFRDKTVFMGVHNLYRRTAVFDNGRRISSTDDIYNNCYLNKTINRSSCFHCEYDSLTVEGDITIGDFKNQYSSIKQAPFDMNGSIIISNTDKGDRVFSELNRLMTIYEIDENDFDYPSHNQNHEDVREAFFEAYVSRTDKLINLLESNVTKKGLFLRLWSVIPDKTRGHIKMMTRKVRNR